MSNLLNVATSKVEPLCCFSASWMKIGSIRIAREIQNLQISQHQQPISFIPLQQTTLAADLQCSGKNCKYRIINKKWPALWGPYSLFFCKKISRDFCSIFFVKK
jgi:hypothetical protein